MPSIRKMQEIHRKYDIAQRILEARLALASGVIR